jgi:hypothetical protein
VGLDLYDHGGHGYCGHHHGLHGMYIGMPHAVTANTCQLFVAWMAGARFDIAYYQAKSELSQLFGWSTTNFTQIAEASKVAEVTKVVEAAAGHSEL